tara:strand:+ start:643 stop:909 length:267 start_codon:yes stop_codon:yes gene_type:complete
MSGSGLVGPFHEHHIAHLHIADCWAKVFVKFALQPVLPRLAAIITTIAHNDPASGHGVNNKADAVNAESVSAAMAPLCSDPAAGFGYA